MSSGAGFDSCVGRCGLLRRRPVVQPMLIHVQPFRDSRQFVVRRYGSPCYPFVRSLCSKGIAVVPQVKSQSEFSRAMHRLRASTQGEL